MRVLRFEGFGLNLPSRLAAERSVLFMSSIYYVYVYLSTRNLGYAGIPALMVRDRARLDF